MNGRRLDENIDHIVTPTTCESIVPSTGEYEYSIDSILTLLSINKLIGLSFFVNLKNHDFTIFGMN